MSHSTFTYATLGAERANAGTEVLNENGKSFFCFSKKKKRKPRNGNHKLMNGVFFSLLFNKKEVFLQKISKNVFVSGTPHQHHMSHFLISSCDHVVVVVEID